MKYVYKFTPEKKLDEKTTRMSAIEVFSIETDKKIGGYAWSRVPKEAQIQYMVSELIREYETRKIWSKVAV